MNFGGVSVIAQQIMTLQGAVQRGEERIIFEDTDINVHISVLYLAVPRCCGAFTPSTRFVSRRAGGG